MTKTATVNPKPIADVIRYGKADSKTHYVIVDGKVIAEGLGKWDAYRLVKESGFVLRYTGSEGSTRDSRPLDAILDDIRYATSFGEVLRRYHDARKLAKAANRSDDIESAREAGFNHVRDILEPVRVARRVGVEVGF